MTNVALAVGDDVQIALAGVLMFDPLKRDSVSLERARHAATAEDLGIQNEILLKELWVSSRTRVDSETRRTLFEKCVAAIEQNRDLDVGRSADIIRAFGSLHDPLRHRELIYRMLHSVRLYHIPFQRLDELESRSMLFELWTNLDEGLSSPNFDDLISVDFDIDEIPLLIQRLRPNSAVSLLLRIIQKNPESAPIVAGILAVQTRDERYVSSLSPHLALTLLRRFARLNHDTSEELILNVLAYLLTPEQMLSMSSGTAVSILEFARRPRLRAVLERFCEAFVTNLLDPGIRPWYRLGRYPTPDHDMAWIEQDLGQSILETIAKAAEPATKKNMYRFVLEFWLRPGRLQLVSSILRYAREVDQGALLFQFVQTRGHNLLRDALGRSSQIAVTDFIPHRSFRNLRLQAIDDLVWFAEGIGDIGSLEKLSNLTKKVVTHDPSKARDRV